MTTGLRRVTKDAKFERGLRSFFEYRDLGIKATQAASKPTSSGRQRAQSFRVNHTCTRSPFNLSMC